MKRHLLLLSALTAHVIAIAQPEVYDELIYNAGVKTRSEFQMVGNEKQLVRSAEFDDLGRTILTQTRNRYNKKDYINTDTSIFYDDFNYTRVALEKNDIYDSIVWHKSRGYFYDTITELTYLQGKIVLSGYYLSDSLPQLASWNNPQTGNSSGHSYDYDYDSAGRITGERHETYAYEGNIHTTKMKYGYTATFGSALITRKHFSENNGVSRPTYISISNYAGTLDSTIMFKSNGSVEYTFTVYRNSDGTDSLSVMRDSNGNVVNRNYTTYGKSFRKTQYTEADGTIWKTEDVTYNRKGLIVSVVETYHKTGETKTRIYEYTYF